MAETVNAGMPVASAPLDPRKRAERLFALALIAAIVVRLALLVGLQALFAMAGEPGILIGRALPWLLLAAAAYGAWGIYSSGAVGLGLAGNRLRGHVITWIVVAVVLLVFAFLGQLLLPLLGFLGKSASILVDFTAAHGLFLAVVCLLIALALAVLGHDNAIVKKPGMVERLWVQNLTAKLAAIPMALVAIGVFTGGTIWTVVYSFTNSKLLPRERWVGLAQYDRLWGENRWVISIENLAIFGFFSLIFSLTIGFLLAVLLDQKIRFENTFRTIFLYPFALSFIVTGLVWQWVLNPEFGIQHVVRSLGWENFTFDPLYNADIVIYGILIAGLWQGTGLIMCLMLAGLRGIDQEIWKASRIDGIPAWKTYMMIVIPMMRPVFITTLVIIAAGIVKVYDLVVAQTSGGPGIASEVPAKYVYDKMFLGQNLAQGFAASTMMLLSVLDRPDPVGLPRIRRQEACLTSPPSTSLQPPRMRSATTSAARAARNRGRPSRPATPSSTARWCWCRATTCCRST